MVGRDGEKRRVRNCRRQPNARQRAGRKIEVKRLDVGAARADEDEFLFRDGGNA